jgi:hypothetical protein
MNAFINQNDPDIDWVLNKLFLECGGLEGNKTKEVTITYYAQDCEDIDGYTKANEFLKNNKIVEEINDYTSGQEPYDSPISGEYEGDTMIFFKETYVFKPNTLIKFLIDTSRIPKYTLDFDEVQCKVVINKKYILGKLDFDGINYTFLSHAIGRNRKVIRRENFLKEASTKNIEEFNKKKRDIDSIIRNILKNRNLVRVFFPVISKDSTYFRNNVTRSDLVSQKINESDIDRFLRTSKKTTNMKAV